MPSTRCAEPGRIAPTGGRREGAAVRARLPDLIIGGAPRSGTTALCHLLSRHPDIHVARPFVPEPKICLFARPGGRDHRQAYAELFADAPAGARTVEKTANYFENTEALARLARVVPGARFVFLLREPAARAWSNYLWSRRNGLETLSFEEALASEETRPSPFTGERAYVRPFDYRRRGYYDLHARNYLAVFPRDRVLFLLYERLITDTEAVCRQIQTFLGVEPRSLGGLTERVNSAVDPGRTPTPDPATMAALRRHFRPHVENFAALTGVDVSPWGY